MNAAEIRINKLPSVPGVLLRLIEACHQPEISFDDIADIIQQDAALTTRIVAIGNSAAYAQWNEQRDFKTLLVALGLDAIKTIAITAAVQQFFSQFRDDAGSHIGTVWQRSLACAYSARRLARLTDYPDPDEAYLAGLLHNLGQLVYLQEFKDRYDPIVELEDQQEQARREKDDFGATSTEMAAYLLQQWIPESFLSDAVLFQRESADAVFDSPPLVRLINLSHKLIEGGVSDQQLLDEADRLFGLGGDVLEELKSQALQELQATLVSYGFEQDDRSPAVDDEQARMALGRQVRDAALAGTLIHGMNGTPWQVILRDFDILFGVPVVAALIYDPQENVLRGSHSESNIDPQRLRQLRLPLAADRSLPAEACLRGKPLSSIDPGLPSFASVVNAQLQRLLGLPELLALPLVTPQGQRLGVLVAGLERDQLEQLLLQRGLLEQFLSAAVEQLQADNYRRQERASLLEIQASNFHAQTRKLAHEANNPLGVVKNYLQILGMKLADDHQAQEQITLIKQEIDRVAGILLRMRDIGSTAEEEENAVELNTLIEEIATLFRMSLFATHGITCELQLDDRIPRLRSNRNQLKQILSNLLKNAVEALDSGGNIHIETNDSVNLDGRQYIQIVVADNGPGIPPDVLDHIFTPVVSRKGPPHSGLGLVIVKNLVSELKGSIIVHSTEESGTRFEILLPRDRANG